MSSTANETELQQEIRRLVVERDQINYRLRHARGGRIGSGMRGGRGYRNAYPSETTRSTNIQNPYTTALDSSPLPPPLPVKRQRDEPTLLTFEGPEFEVEKRPKIIIDDKTEERNRRMLNFGVLGHLNRARDQLQKEETSKQAQLQKSKVQRVAEKLQHGKNNLMELRRLHFESKRNEDVKKAENVEQQLIEKENELLRMHLARHYQNMKNFISTKTFPTLFWLPAVMDEKTEQLKMETVKIIEVKIETLRNMDFSASSSTVQIAEPLPMVEEAAMEMPMEEEMTMLSSDASKTAPVEPVTNHEEEDDTMTFPVYTSADVAVKTSEINDGKDIEVPSEDKESFWRTSVREREAIFQSDMEVSETLPADAEPLLNSSDGHAVKVLAPKQKAVEKNHASPIPLYRNSEDGKQHSSRAKSKETERSPTKTRSSRRSSGKAQSPAINDQDENLENFKKDISRTLLEAKKNNDSILTHKEVDEMTVASLVQHLKEKGLCTQGKKAVLKERLLKYLES